MQSFRSLDDADVKGKRVLVRVDLNVPMADGKVADATRIEEIAPTITELAGKGGKVILLSHLNRPKGRDPKDSLKPVAAAVARIVKKPVAFAEDCIGPAAEKAIAAMQNGDILCLENTRFHPEEENNDSEFARRLAALGESSSTTRFRRRIASMPPTPRSSPSPACPLIRAAPCAPSSTRWSAPSSARSIRSPRSSAAPRSRPSSSSSAICSPRSRR